MTHSPHNCGVFSCLGASEPYGSCELLMSLLSHGGAIGGLMALLVQLSGPTPLRALLSGPVQVAIQSAVVQPAAARTSVAASGVRDELDSLPHLQIPACPNAACAGR
jgi:hypothetical protein